MEAVAIHVLDGADLGAVERAGGEGARGGGHPVDDDGAGAADPGAAHDLGPRQAELVADDLGGGGARVELE
ncbi:MAG: hypothetical protein R3F14_21760 [Polyangiaceae bacterium]